MKPREAEWDARWWSPIINAEHLAMREHAGLFDLSAFAIFDVQGPGALDALQRSVLAQMDVAVGRVVYTPVLAPGGGFRSDLTIMRLGDDEFRIVTGGAHGMADRKLFSDQLPDDGSATLVDVTTAWTTIGLWGPRARDILSTVTSDDVSNAGFPFGTCRVIEIGSQLVLASRISYVGDLGWELYVPIEQGARLWDVVWEAGQPHGLTACGIGVYGTTGRLEKCYRAFAAELESEYTVVEAGMARPTVKEQDFVGKEAHLRHREEEPAAILCTLTVDDHTSRSGVERFPLGREPITLRDGDAPHRRQGPPLVRDQCRCGPLARQVHPDGVPAARAGRRGLDRARRRVHGRALPRDRRRRRLGADLRPGEHEDPLVRILVAVKRVPMTGGRIVLTEDEQAIETRHLGFTISPHEECGVEETVRLIEANGGESVVLTLGPGEAEEQLRDAMAIGIDRAVHLVTDGEEWDPQATSCAILEVIREDEAANGPFDLLFFGNESADTGGYQVGIRIAHALGRPVATGLKAVTVDDGTVRCEQEVAGGRDVYVLPLPAVVTVKEGLNLPRYPSVPGRLRAQRKPLEASSPVRPEPRLERLRLVVPEGEGKQAEILGEGAAAAPRVVEVLQQIGVV